MPSAAVQPIVALIADPVGGNPHQYMMEKAFADRGLDWRYLTAEVSTEHLGDAVRGIRALGFAGGHCGHPHKQTVIPFLDRMSETAAMVEAVNLLVREGDALVGENTEGKGFLASLRRVTDPAGKRIVLLGAGRVARAIGVELAMTGAAEIRIANRTLQHAQALADLVAGKLHVAATPVVWEGDFQVPAETDVLVGATSIGHQDPEARVPLEPDSLRPGMVVADVTPNPPNTWLVREAAGRGCATVDGLGMYIEQVAIDFGLWTGVQPDRDVLREAIEEFWEL